MPEKEPNAVTLIQASRIIGVTLQAVRGRVERGQAATVECGGEPMLWMTDVRQWQRERAKRAKALTAVPVL
jgi:hypothetical protein